MNLTYQNTFVRAIISTHAALLSVVVVLGIQTAPAYAASLIQADVGDPGTQDCEYSGGAGTPSNCAPGDEVAAGLVSAGATVPSTNENFPQAIGASSATLGSLGNFAHGISRDNFVGVGPTVFANAKFVIDDLIFTGPGATVTTSLNFFVDGFITGSSITGGPVTPGAFFLEILANGGFVGNGTVNGDNVGSAIANDGFFAATGTSSSVSGLFTTGPIVFDVGVAQSLQLRTFAKATSVLTSDPLVPDGTTVAQVIVDFSNTTNLPDHRADLRS